MNTFRLNPYQKQACEPLQHPSYSNESLLLPSFSAFWCAHPDRFCKCEILKAKAAKPRKCDRIKQSKTAVRTV